MTSAVQTDQAPGAIGPYSQAIVAGGWVFTAGQIGITPQDGRLADSIEGQTRRAMTNIGEILAAAGCGWEHVVRTTVYLKDIAHFAAFNAVYAGFVKEPKPARSTVQAAALPKDALVEIDAVAYRSDD